MDAGEAMAGGVEPSSIETRPNRRRVPLLGLIAGTLLVIAAAALWVHVVDPYNPYRPGTHHEVTLTNHEGCPNTWSVQLASGSYHYSFRGGAPRGWNPDGVPGTLTILHNWSSTGTDAEFEANGKTMNLKGGSDHPAHFIDGGCAVS